MDEIIQFLKAALTPVTAVVACWVALRQYQAKKLVLNLARYDKRFKVYQALKDFIADVIDNPKISPDAVRRFDIATNEASFLFEDDICDYLTLVRQRSQAVGHLSLEIEEDLSANREMNEKRSQLVRQNQESLSWFFDQFSSSKKKFERYLSVRDNSSSCCSCDSNGTESK